MNIIRKPQTLQRTQQNQTIQAIQHLKMGAVFLCNR